MDLTFDFTTNTIIINGKILELEPNGNIPLAMWRQLTDEEQEDVCFFLHAQED
jgi:hypothetical protein